MLLAGPQEPVAEPCPVQRGPEAIARPGEVMACGAGIESRVDPAEQDPQAGSDQIGNRAARGGKELGPRGPGRPTHLVSSRANASTLSSG